MDNFLAVVNGMALLLGGLGIAVTVSYVAYSGFPTQGEPQRLAQARNSLIGVAVGVVLIGGSFATGFSGDGCWPTGRLPHRPG